MKANKTRYLIFLLILTIIITFSSFSCGTQISSDQTIEEPAEETEPNIALEIVELAKSQIGKLTGDGPFASLIWADSEITYCDRFVSAVMAVASGKPLSERKSYPTAYDDYIAHEGLIKSGEPPKGAVLYYEKHKENWNCGHVGISDGEGNIISVVNRTKGVDITPLNYFRAPLLGWVTFKEYKSEEPAVEEEPALVDESLISTLSTSPHPWPMRYHDTQRTSRSPFVGPAELPVLKWTFKLDRPSYLWQNAPIVVAADNTVYCSVCWGDYWHEHMGCGLYAINPDGTLKWSFEPGEEDISMYGDSPCIGADGTIYIASSGKDADSTLYAINPNGTVKWKCSTGKDDIYKVLLGTNSIFVIVSGQHDTKELLTISYNGNLKDLVIPPREDMLSNVSMSIGADGTLYSGHKRLYAWSADGTVKWMYDAGMDIYTPPVIGDDGTIYVIFHRSRLHAINPDGTLKWATGPLGIEHNMPAIGLDGTVYVASERDGALCTLNPEDGTPKLVYDLRENICPGPIIDGEGTIYVRGWRLYAINPDGTLKWSYAGEGSGIDAIGTDSTIYNVSGSVLYAISD